MTKAKLILELKKLKGADPEAEHSRADDLLIDFIDDEDIKRAFNNVNKWYA